MFEEYHVGQKVLYTGETTYGHKVVNAKATIDVIGGCISLILDDSRKRYRSSSTNPANDGIDVIPQPQRASANIGDLTNGCKKIIKI